MVIRDVKYGKQVVYYDCDVKSIQSALDPDDTNYYYKDIYIGTLRISTKAGQVGISFKFDDKLMNSEFDDSDDEDY